VILILNRRFFYVFSQYVFYFLQSYKLKFTFATRMLNLNNTYHSFPSRRRNRVRRPLGVYI